MKPTSPSHPRSANCFGRFQNVQSGGRLPGVGFWQSVWQVPAPATDFYFDDIAISTRVAPPKRPQAPLTRLASLRTGQPRVAVPAHWWDFPPVSRRNLYSHRPGIVIHMPRNTHASHSRQLPGRITTGRTTPVATGVRMSSDSRNQRDLRPGSCHNLPQQHPARQTIRHHRVR
jgi:hypothetical protein